MVVAWYIDKETFHNKKVNFDLLRFGVNPVSVLEIQLNQCASSSFDHESIYPFRLEMLPTL